MKAHTPRIASGATHRAPDQFEPRYKRAVITALALLLAVKPHRRALGKARGAQYRAIEIERHPGECQGYQPCDDPLPQHLLEVLDTVLVSPARRGADYGIFYRRPERALVEALDRYFLTGALAAGESAKGFP